LDGGLHDSDARVGYDRLDPVRQHGADPLLAAALDRLDRGQVVCMVLVAVIHADDDHAAGGVGHGTHVLGELLLARVGAL
jgi:hypothetical protein